MKKTLVLAGPKPKKVELALTGTTISTTTWNAKGTPKTTSKAVASPELAAREFEKAVRKKLRDDYVALGVPEPGAIILEAFASGGGGGAILDLSRDGKLVVTASMTKESSFGIKIELVEVATGSRTIVVEEPPGVRQNFLHSVMFDRDGKGLYFVLCDVTEYVDIATKQRTRITNEARLNSFVVKPSFDAERRRLLVIDGYVVRVIDDRRETLCEIDTIHATTECRGAAISPSGRYLALYIASRGVTYNHEDARSDTTNLVNIYDVETGSLWETVTVDKKISALGLSPDEKELVVSWYYADGPAGLTIPSGEEIWSAGDVNRDWAFSPDGTLLALSGERQPRVLTFPGREPAVELEPITEFGRCDRVVISADGTRLATWHGGTAYVMSLSI